MTSKFKGAHILGVMWWPRKRKKSASNSSGQRSPDWPPSEASPIDVYRYYLDFYEKDFTRTRAVVKARASAVVVWSAILAALTAVVGAITSLTGLSWLGIVTVVLSGTAAVVAAWDSHFRHREHWKQKSSVLNELQLMKREFSFSLATEQDLGRVAQAGMTRLDVVLSRDLSSWLGLRKQKEAEAAGPPTSAADRHP